MTTKQVFDPLVKLTVSANGSGHRPMPAEIEIKPDRKIVADSVFDRLAKRANWSKRTDKLLSMLQDDHPMTHALAAVVLLRAQRGKEALSRLNAIQPAAFGSLPKEAAIQTLALALEDPDCSAQAISLGQALVSQNRPTQRYQDVKPFDSLSLTMSDVALRRGLDPKVAEQSIRDYLDLSAHENDRYSISNASRRLGQLSQIADLMLEHDRLQQAMTYLAMRQSAIMSGGDPVVDESGLRMLTLIDRLDDRVQAFQTLADWKFQGDGALQDIIAIGPRTDLPDWLPGSTRDDVRRSSFVDDELPLVTSYLFLARLARDADKVDELQKRYLAAQEAGRTGADIGWAMTQTFLGRPVDEAVLEGAADRIAHSKPAGTTATTRTPLAELQLAMLMIDQPDHEPLVRQIVTETQGHLEPFARRSLVSWLARYRFRRGWIDVEGWQPIDGSGDWLRSQSGSAGVLARDQPRPVWLRRDDGAVRHLYGSATDPLHLRYPLAGNFEFQVVIPHGNPRDASVAAHGLQFYTASSRTYLGVSAGTQRDAVTLYTEAFAKEKANRMTVRFDDDFVSCLVGDQVIYQEARLTGPTWLGLVCGRDADATADSVRIAGDPVIPRRVDLMADPTLREWSAAYYGGTLPTGRIVGEAHGPVVTRTRPYRTGVEPGQLDELTWSYLDGELVSGRTKKTKAGGQSCLHYKRPLAKGETVRYEFFFEPESHAVYPVINRVAYLFREDGVRRHWMTAGASDDQVPHDNEFAVPQSVAPPLRPAEWNQVQLRRMEDGIEVSLNGQVMATAPWDSDEIDPRFGLFHYSDRTAARVRDMTLEGDWPEELPSGLRL